MLSSMFSMRSRDSSSRVEVEEDNRSRPRFLCGNNSLGRKNSRGLNIGDSIEDGGTITDVGIGIENMIRMMVNSFKQGFVNQFKVHEENIMASADKLASVGNEFEKLRVMAAQLKETRKIQKSLDGNELPVEIEEDQTSLYKDDDKTIRG
nr:hypothetical protein [Tanacetum cinerariifolium]